MSNIKASHKKKIKVIDSESSVKAKAMRLRKVRNMAQLSRQIFDKIYNINFNTLKGWEVGRHGGLTEKGSQQICEVLKDRGFLCTIEWLMYGIGTGPQPLFAPNTSRSHHQLRESRMTYQLKSFISHNKEDKQMIRELQFFRQKYPKTLSMIVDDDAMEPYYSKGELVAGVRIATRSLKKLLNQPCIIQTQSGRLLLRVLKSGDENGFYNLTALNPHTKEERILRNINVINAAPIIWIRRKNKL